VTGPAPTRPAAPSPAPTPSPAPSIIPPGLDATVVLLRHGESAYVAEGRFQGRADSSLSPLGERQAALAAGRIAAPGRSPRLPIPTRPPLEIVHSPLTRTTQTARLVAAAIAGAPPLRPEPGLTEIAQGEWEGMTRTEVEARHAARLAAWRRTPLEANAPGGERIVDVRDRVGSALDGLLGRLAVEPSVARSETTASGYPPAAATDTPWTLVVGHDGAFKVALLALLGLPLERFWTFPFAMCGITVVEIRGGLPVLRAHNLTEHLAPLADENPPDESADRGRAGAL
jgi:probable phosphoglycerate mutase